MDQWGPKHVELTYVMNKTQSLKNFVHLVGLHIYYKTIHAPYNIKFINWVTHTVPTINSMLPLISVALERLAIPSVDLIKARK